MSVDGKDGKDKINERKALTKVLNSIRVHDHQ
jgi:hypothetical protein